MLETRHSHYEPHLKPDDPYFKRDDNRPLPLTVYTVPTTWSADDLPGTVQVQATMENACPDPIERKAYARLAAWAGGQAVKLALRAELLRARQHAVASSDWREQVLDLFLGNHQDLTTILKARHAVIRRFAEELKRVGGENCIAACVRAYRPLSDEIHYAVCVGAAWTNEARETLFNVKIATIGRAALQSPSPIYYDDVDEVHGHTRVLEKAEAIWAKRFIVRGVVRGVASLSWSVKKPCTPELLELLASLITQFEAIRDEFAVHEDVFFRQLESTVLNRDPEETRIMARKLAAIFDAKHCSLLIDRDRDEVLELYATTHREGAEAVKRKQYAFGEGITGWVAKHRKAVSIRDPADQAELEAVARRHGVEEPIRPAGPLSETPPSGEYYGVLAAPMIARGRVLGVIRLGAVPPHSDFEHEAEAFLLGIADRLAYEFDRIWIEEDANEQIKQLQQRAQHAEAQNNAVDFDDAVKAALEEASISAGADGAYIHVVDPEGQIRSIQSSGILTSFLGTQYQFPPETNLYFTPDMWADDTLASFRKSLEKEFGPQARELVRAGAFVRLLNKEAGVRATLCLCFRVVPTRSRQWGEWLDKLETTTSSALRPALRLARVQRQLQNQLNALNEFHKIGSAYALANGASEVARAVLASSLKETGMELGVIRIYDHAKEKWTRIASMEEAGKEIFPDELGTNNALRRCLNAKNSLVLHGLDKDEAWLEDLRNLPEGYRKGRLEQVRSWVCVPMLLPPRRFPRGDHPPFRGGRAI